MEKTGSKGW